MYWEFSNHNSFAQCGAAWLRSIPGVTCNSDGNISYRPTWAVEVNYYMDLGFLPANMQYFSISGRAGWYGKKGSDTEPLPALGCRERCLHRRQDRVQQRADPADLRRRRRSWGPKWSHYVDVWVAYRYWQNKFGLDHNAPIGRVSATLAASTVQSAAPAPNLDRLLRHHGEVLTT